MFLIKRTFEADAECSQNLLSVGDRHRSHLVGPSVHHGWAGRQLAFQGTGDRFHIGQKFPGTGDEFDLGQYPSTTVGDHEAVASDDVLESFGLSEHGTGLGGKVWAFYVQWGNEARIFGHHPALRPKPERPLAHDRLEHRLSANQVLFQLPLDPTFQKEVTHDQGKTGHEGDDAAGEDQHLSAEVESHGYTAQNLKLS